MAHRRSSAIWGLLTRAARTRRGWIGLLLAGLVIVAAFVGPFVAPYSPTQLFGAPFTPPDSAHWLGLDYVGRDVLSRVLAGGVTILPLAIDRKSTRLNSSHRT